MPYIHQNTMKKISVIILSSTLAFMSATAFACPKGTSLQGGTYQIIKAVNVWLYQVLKQNQLKLKRKKPRKQSKLQK